MKSGLPQTAKRLYGALEKIKALEGEILILRKHGVDSILENTPLQRKLDRAMKFLKGIDYHSCDIDDWVVDEAREVRREIEEME